MTDSKNLPTEQEDTTQEVFLRSKETGRFVVRIKTIDETELTKNKVPNYFFQIQNNILQVVDIKGLLKEIESTWINDKIFNATLSHERLRDKISTYVSYGDGLEKIYEHCVEKSPEFNQTIKLQIENFKKLDSFSKIKEIDTIEKLFGYNIKLLFVLLYSTFAKRLDEFHRDEVVPRRIDEFRLQLQGLLENLLAPNHIPSKDFDENSLYPSILFDKNFGESELERIISYDSRFKSYAGVIRAIPLQRDRGQITFTRRFEEFSDRRHMPILALIINTLDEVDRLIALREQICNTVDADNAEKILKMLQLKA